MDYDFEIPRICKEIEKHKAKRVLLQFPEGLKVHSKKVADEITAKTDCDIVISCDPCFGACDIQKPKDVGCDLTVHFAHSKMLDVPNIIYIECAYKGDCTEVAKKAMAALGCGKIGLITTAQHIHQLSKVKKVLEEQCEEVHIGKKGPLCTYDGQILGCDLGSALNIKDKVDSFLFIGSGKFHPLALSYFTKKRVMQSDPYTGSGGEVNAKEWEKERCLRIEKAHDAKEYGVVVGVKPGQQHMAAVLDAKKKLEEKDKKAYLISMGEITPEKIEYLPFDAFVITACPRIVLDDWKNYPKPVMLPNEIDGL